MTATACGHGMPSPLSCIDCMNDEGVGAAPNEQTVEGVTTARFDSRCGCGCGTEIVVGERIALLSEAGWVTSECARRLCDEAV